jgi:hypothetical protein
MKREQLQSIKKAWRVTDFFSFLRMGGFTRIVARQGGPAPTSVGSGGFSLVEVVLATASLALFVLMFVGGFVYGEEGTALAGKRMRAAFLAEEGQEVVQNMRDENFANLVDGTYGLATTTTPTFRWIFSGIQDVTDIFTREVTIATIDTHQKSASTTITWQQNEQRMGNITLSSKFGNWVRTVVADWTNPTLQGSANINNGGNTASNGSALAISGNYAYVGRLNGTGNEFFIYSISTSGNPTLLGSRPLNGNPNGIVISGNYAYIASSDNASELQIIDISDPTTIQNAGKLTVVDLTVANSANATSDGLAIKSDGSYVYMARATGGNTFLIFDIRTTPATPGNPIGRISTVTAPNDIAISGNYAYFSSTDNVAELQVVDMTNKTAPVRVDAFDLNSGNNNADGLSVEALGQNQYVIVGRVASGAPEIYMISVVNPAVPVLMSTLEVGFNVLNSATDPNLGYGFFVTANTNLDFLVVDAIDPAGISLLGSYNIASNGPINIKYSTALDRAFIVGTSDTQELQVIQP